MSLIHHWKLDDNAASTTVVATVGTNATLQGGDNTQDKSVAGPGGSITLGLDLNGIDDFVQCSAITLSVPWSVSVWVKFNSGVGIQYVAGRDNTSPYIRKNTDTSIGVRQNSGSVRNFDVPSLGDDWHHMLVICDGTNSRVFIDGTESSTGPQSHNFAYAWRDIGSYASGNFADICVAQCKLFDSDESANVAALFAEGSGGGATVPALDEGMFRGGLQLLSGGLT